MKRCYMCGNHKDFGLFYKDRTKTDNLSPRCKECDSKKSKKYAEKSDYKKNYTKKWKEQNKDRVKTYNKAWQQDNKASCYHRSSLYRARKKQAIPVWFENQLVSKVYEKATELGLEVDHVVPLKSEYVCGLHCWHNLQLLTTQDNVSKKNRHWPDMWEAHGQKVARSP
jgi:site-specific DNA-cytosine methylase